MWRHYGVFLYIIAILSGPFLLADSAKQLFFTATGWLIVALCYLGMYYDPLGIRHRTFLFHPALVFKSIQFFLSITGIKKPKGDDALGGASQAERKRRKGWGGGAKRSWERTCLAMFAACLAWILVVLLFLAPAEDHGHDWNPSRRGGGFDARNSAGKTANAGKGWDRDAGGGSSRTSDADKARRYSIRGDAHANNLLSTLSSMYIEKLKTQNAITHAFDVVTGKNAGSRRFRDFLEESGGVDAWAEHLDQLDLVGPTMDSPEKIERTYAFYRGMGNILDDFGDEVADDPMPRAEAKKFGKFSKEYDSASAAVTAYYDLLTDLRLRAVIPGDENAYLRGKDGVLTKHDLWKRDVLLHLNDRLYS